MLFNQRIILFLLIGFTFLSEAEAQQLQGRVTDFRGKSLSGVTVVNTDAKKGTLTNNRGRYAINFKPGDTITFSSLGYNTFELVFTEIPEKLNDINITLELKTEELDEVILNSNDISETEINKIIEQNFGMFQNERKSQTERRAYTASSSGGGIVSFDYILNLINGRIKRLKMLSNWERQDAIIDELQAMMPESFYLENLGLRSEQVYPFLLYCLEISQNGLSAEMAQLDIVAFFTANIDAFKSRED